MTVSAVIAANKFGMRTPPIRHSVFDIFRVEGEVGGIGQETLSIAPAHERSHKDDDSNQGNQSNYPKDRPNKGFIFEEGLSGFGSST